MTADTTTPPPSKHRGTIIVDANILFALETPVPEKFMTINTSESDAGTPSTHYLNIFPFLAKQGYKIVIPEMVMYETSDLLLAPNGHINIRDYFSHSSANHKHKHEDKTLRDFFLNVIDGKYPNITISPSTEHETGFGFLENIRKTVQKYPLGTPEGFVEIVNLQKLDKAHFGDDAILTLLKNATYQRSPHIFVLSNDMGLLNKSANLDKDNVSPLNLRGFIYAIRKNNLHHALSIKNATSSSDILNDMEVQISARRNCPYNLSKMTIDGRRGERNIQYFDQRMHTLELATAAEATWLARHSEGSAAPTPYAGRH